MLTLRFGLDQDTVLLLEERHEVSGLEPESCEDLSRYHNLPALSDTRGSLFGCGSLHGFSVKPKHYAVLLLVRLNVIEGERL